jgi:hypothetical protein
VLARGYSRMLLLSSLAITNLSIHDTRCKALFLSSTDASAHIPRKLLRFRMNTCRDFMSFTSQLCEVCHRGSEVRVIVHGLPILLPLYGCYVCRRVVAWWGYAAMLSCLLTPWQELANLFWRLCCTECIDYSLCAGV